MKPIYLLYKQNFTNKNAQNPTFTKRDIYGLNNFKMLTIYSLRAIFFFFYLNAVNHRQKSNIDIK